MEKYIMMSPLHVFHCGLWLMITWPVGGNNTDFLYPGDVPIHRGGYAMYDYTMVQPQYHDAKTQPMDYDTINYHDYEYSNGDYNDGENNDDYEYDDVDIDEDDIEIEYAIDYGGNGYQDIKRKRFRDQTYRNQGTFGPTFEHRYSRMGFSSKQLFPIPYVGTLVEGYRPVMVPHIPIGTNVHTQTNNLYHTLRKNQPKVGYEPIGQYYQQQPHGYQDSLKLYGNHMQQKHGYHNNHGHHQHGFHKHGHHNNHYHHGNHGYHHQQPHGYHNNHISYGYHQQPHGYHSHHQMSYGYHGGSSHGYNKHNKHRGYKKPKKVYKPVILPKKKKKKMKILSIDRGFFIPGGHTVFKKFRSVKGCMKACAKTPTCFAADYNPWLGRCYFHSNLTACQRLHSHKKVIHFKKVPCRVPHAPRGLIILGAQLHFAIEQKGIKDLNECIKKCATAGTGIPLTNDDIDDQICFGIDYDFGSHKCYFHVRNINPDNRICGEDDLITPRDLIAHPSNVFISLCPDMAT